MLFSDFDFRSSGYLTINIGLLKGLAERGHEIKAVGLGYRGEEHSYPFSIISAPSMQDALGIMQNLWQLWKFDVMVVSMDIYQQEPLLQSMVTGRPFPYVGIMPLEAEPLCMSWAMVLMGMDKACIISEFGVAEAQKVGVTNAVYLPVGIDTTAWPIPTPEEKTKLRASFGFTDEDFIVLTVAANQERKNLSAGMEIIKEASPNIPNLKYLMVTMENFIAGWKLRDYSRILGIDDQFFIFERGIAHKNLWGLYAISDAFLLPSKAEGLGLIILEAMSCGVPVIGTDCTAIHELLWNGRGFLVPPAYQYVDPFGNENRYFIDVHEGSQQLISLYNDIHEQDGEADHVIYSARMYVEGRTIKHSVDVFEEVLLSVVSKEDKNVKTTS